MVNKSQPNTKSMAIQVLVPLPEKDSDCDTIRVSDRRETPALRYARQGFGVYCG